MLRVLKLMRLAKLLSASRLLQHWETQLLVNYGAAAWSDGRALTAAPRTTGTLPARAAAARAFAAVTAATAAAAAGGESTLCAALHQPNLPAKRL